MASMISPGFYGKVPVLGDFVSRRVSHDFIAGWDGWLQSAIACSKEELGARWLECYLTSPIWRFVLSPGVCGQQAWAGVMMASVDRVGRYFPLTIVLEIEDFQSVALWNQNCDRWFSEIESIALSVLEKDLSVNEIESMLSGVNNDCWRTQSMIIVGDDHQQERAFAKKAFLLQSQQAETPLSLQLLGLTGCLINHCFKGYSLWQTGGSETVNSAMLLCEGLPPVNAYSGLLTGQMPDRGWNLRTQLIVGEPRPQPEKGHVETENRDCLLNLHEPLDSTSEIWRSQSAIHRGKRRQLNEDALLDRPEKGIWVIADGMGGHQAGDVASQMIVDAMDQLSPAGDLQSSIKRVNSCLHQVNARLRQFAADRYDNQIVGSTVVALIAGDGRFACIWAGDSRLYRLRDKQLMQITVDHCEDAIELEGLPDTGMQSVKSNNVITRAVGAFDGLELDCEEVDYRSGDKFLLCSDGVDKELSPIEIERILNEVHRNYADAVMQEVLAKQARDNISLIVIEVR